MVPPTGPRLLVGPTARSRIAISSVRVPSGLTLAAPHVSFVTLDGRAGTHTAAPGGGTAPPPHHGTSPLLPIKKTRKAVEKIINRKGNALLETKALFTRFPDPALSTVIIASKPSESREPNRNDDPHPRASPRLACGLQPPIAARARANGELHHAPLGLRPRRSPWRRGTGMLLRRRRGTTRRSLPRRQPRRGLRRSSLSTRPRPRRA